MVCHTSLDASQILERINSLRLPSGLVLIEVGFTRSGVKSERVEELLYLLQKLSGRPPLFLVPWRDPRDLYRSRIEHDMRGNPNHPLWRKDPPVVDTDFVERMHEVSQGMTCSAPYCMQTRPMLSGLCASACAEVGFRQTDPAKLTPAPVLRTALLKEPNLELVSLPLSLLREDPTQYWNRAMRILPVPAEKETLQASSLHLNQGSGRLSLTKGAQEWIDSANSEDLKWMRTLDHVGVPSIPSSD